MSHTFRAFRKLINAIGSDTKGSMPLLMASAIGGVVGVGCTLGVAMLILVPEAEARAARRAEFKVNERTENATEEGYRQGIMDLVEGRVTLEEEVERAFILVRKFGDRVDRFPIDPRHRELLRAEGWDLGRRSFEPSLQR